MPRIKLTEKSISKLHAPTGTGKQIIHWDAELRGFGVLLSGVSNSKAFICQRDLPGGRTRRITIAATNEISLTEAKDRAREILVDMRKGLDPKRKVAGTLQECLLAYLQTNRDLTEQSRKMYTKLVNRHLAAWLPRPLASITPQEVDRMHAAIAAKVARGGRYTGHSVANYVMALLRLLYNWQASRDDTLPRNPVRIRGSEWHKVVPRRNPIPAERLKDFYSAVDKQPPMGRDYLLLALFTGMRRREISALSWEEVDFTARLIRLPAKRAKAKRALDLPMSDFVRDLLVARRQLGNARYVFPSYGRSGHIEDISPWIDVVTANTGIQFSAHDCRRTFITIAESTDISVHSLKALVNHSLGSGVTESYIKMSPERLRDPVQKVADKMKLLCGVVAPEGDKVATLRG